MPDGVNGCSGTKPQNKLCSRDAAKQEADKSTKHSANFDLEIVIDVRSFTITHLAEPEEEIYVPKQAPVLLPMKRKDLYFGSTSSYRMRGVKSYH